MKRGVAGCAVRVPVRAKGGSRVRFKWQMRAVFCLNFDEKETEKTRQMRALSVAYFARDSEKTR